MQHPKVVVLGAGSLFFGRQAIWQMVHSPILQKGTLGLVDTDPERIKKMSTLAKMVIEEKRVPLKLEASGDRRDVLKDADFVVLSFADRSVMFRGIDCNVSLKYGIRMCSGDTIGPGGIFRTMREFPVILKCAKDIKELCPDAWVINYINPTAVHGIGLKRFALELKSFALCDGLHMPHVKHYYAVRAGIIASKEEYTNDIDRKFDLRIAGVNHFTWILKAEYNGRDVMPEIGEATRKAGEAETERSTTDSKELFNEKIGYLLYKAFGYVPACVCHTKEYVRYWQGHGKAPDTIPPLYIWDTEERYKWHDRMWEQVDDFINGRKPIAEYTKTFGPDHATDIIESMVGNLGKPFYVNTFNEGAISNMNDDAFLELLCDLDMKGPRPRHVGEMPRGIRGQQELVLDTHELTAEAVAKGDKKILRRAMLTDPLINSIPDGDSLINELLEKEKDALPGHWFK